MLIVLNDGLETFVGPGKDVDFVAGLISGIVDLAPSFRGRLDRSEARAVEDFRFLKIYAKELISLNATNKLRMSLKHFSFKDQNRVPAQIAEYMLLESTFGKEVLELFDEIGIADKIFGSLVKRDNRSCYKRHYHVYLAGLVMCTSGINGINELNRDVIFRWLSYYYNFAKKSFSRPDIMPVQLDVHKKIFKEIAKGLGGYLNDPEIIELGLTRRVGVSSSSNILELTGDQPHLGSWSLLWKKWRATQPPLAKAPTSSLNLLCGYLDHYKNVCADPVVFLGAPRDRSLLEFCQSRRIEKGLSAIAGSDEIPTLFRFSKFVTRELQTRFHSNRIHDLVTDEEDRAFKIARKKLGLNERLAEAAATPLPTRYYNLMREILEEGEGGWPGRHRLCRAVIKGVNRYVPVLATLYLVLFEIPLRTVGVRRLCSGEGDKESFDGHRLAWVENRSPHAGYWARIERSNPFRGYARRTNSPNITGFFINTNKHSPAFVVPWQNADLHRRLYDLKVWQETWNPVTGPVQLEYDGDPEDGAKDRLPKVFPLFRMPAGRNPANIHPVQYTQVNRFWLDLMLEIQTRWNATCAPEDRDVFVTLSKSGKQVQSSRYKSHGMRVAGITILLQEGMPIELISKFFAGHATILQSLYYAKFQADHLSKKFDDIKVNGKSIERNDLFSELKEMEYSDALSRTVNGSDDALRLAMQAHAGSKGSWQRRDVAICPYNGMRCGDGNPAGGMVEGGDGNCLLCIHHLCGPEYGHAIWSNANHLLFLISRSNKQIAELVSENDVLQLQLQSLSVGNSDYQDIHARIRRTELKIDQLANEQVPWAKTFAKSVKLLYQFEALESSDMTDNDGSAVLVVSEGSSFDWAEVSEIEQAYLLQQNAKIYKSTYDPEVDYIVERFANEAMMRCGYQPIAMKTRSKEQVKKASEYAVRRILAEASSHELRQVETGAISIEELLSDEVSAEIFLKGLQLTPLAVPRPEPAKYLRVRNDR